MEGKEEWRGMPVARRETCDGRVIAHVDMDCFYVQGSSLSLSLIPSNSYYIQLGFHNHSMLLILNANSGSGNIYLLTISPIQCFVLCVVEQRKQPSLRGLPTAVIQYNSYKGGALIAVSYEARKCGVKR